MSSSLQDMLDSMFRVDYTAEKEAARRDPASHKLTRVMEKPLSYRYCVQKKTRGSNVVVWWCWSCHRNVAGYFLAWREVRTRDRHGRVTVRRDDWKAHRVKNRLKERARRIAASKS